MAENLPSGTAYKPSDVVVMADGRTVEIGAGVPLPAGRLICAGADNTDAEGRMLLGDAIVMAQRERLQDAAPSEVLTVAFARVATLCADTPRARAGRDADGRDS